MLNIFVIFLFAFLFSFFLSKYFIMFFKRRDIYQSIRHEVPYNHHLFKQKIPTMGGIIIIITLLCFSFLYILPVNFYLLWVILYFVFNALIGFWDDYLKIFSIRKHGLTILQKYILQSIVTLVFVFIFTLENNVMKNIIYIPLINYSINIGLCYPLLMYFILVGFSNAVNLTDGLDGLVVFPLILNVLFIIIISYISGNCFLSSFFKIKFLFYSKYILIMSSVLLGALLSFLLFNFYPAKVFMGDVGSLSLGALIASIFIILHKEIFLLILGFPFIIETISVILQIISYKFFNTRLFKITPLHHHFELQGFSEIKIVVFVWVFSLILFYLCLLILVI